MSSNENTRPQPSGETREAVARIIDPFIWDMDYEKGGTHTWIEGRRMAREKALKQADAILALLSARPLALGGQQGVDRGRVEAIVREAVIAASVDVPDKFADRVATRFEITQNATDALVSALSTTPARAEAQDEGAAGEPEWVVNDIAELGVKIGERFYWLYKGQSLVYGKHGDDVKDGVVQHDDGGNMHWRPVFKREFGECCHPVNYADPTRIGTVSLDDSDDWKPLPAAHPSPTPAADGLEPFHARQIAEAMDEGDGFWKPCSGCQEGMDGYVSQKDYPFNPVFRCQPSGGCSECGGLGVLWDDTDYDAMAKAMLADMDAEDSNPTPAADADRVRIAMEALEPFAREAEGWPAPTWTDEKTVTAFRNLIVVGDLRRAAEALAALKSEGK